ncbi:MAG: hypothetical protein U9Q69_02695 [Nanoarchaeota archaeon]|nr:hypothetical protein [Nanoarchaeota archaeon]
MSSVVLADSLNILNEDYLPGEVLMANLETENFQLADLSLLGNSSNSIPIGFLSYKKSESSYLVYFNVPELENQTCSLSYNELNDTFMVMQGNSISVSPPIIRLASEKNKFSLELKNNAEETIEVEIKAAGSHIKPVRPEMSLSPLGKKTLYVNYNDTGSSNLIISYNGRAYNIEILGIEKEEIEEPLPEPQLEGQLKFVDAAPISHSVTIGQEIGGILEFTNTFPVDLHNITFHASDDLAGIIDFNVSIFPVIKPNESLEQFIWINKNQNALPKRYQGVILLNCKESYSHELQLEVEFTADYKIDEPEAEEGFKVVGQEDFNLTGDLQIGGESEAALEEKEKNRLLGIIIVAGVIILALLIGWRLRPKPRILKFKEYLKSLAK